jgi:hypothetical protein
VVDEVVVGTDDDALLSADVHGDVAAAGEVEPAEGPQGARLGCRYAGALERGRRARAPAPVVADQQRDRDRDEDHQRGEQGLGQAVRRMAAGNRCGSCRHS